MKKVLLLVLLLTIGIVFAGCDVTYDVQKNGSVLIIVECDEDDVDEFGESLDFDEGDLDSKEDLEDILDDILDEVDDMEGEISVKNFKRTKNDDFTLTFEYMPASDVEDAFDNDEIVWGTAADVLEVFAEFNYDDDFDDIYDKEFSDDVDDEEFYVYDAKGDELDDKEMEQYFDKANLSKLNAVWVYNLDDDADLQVKVPGKIQAIISEDDVDIEDDAITFDYDALIVYSNGGGFGTTLLIILLVAALGAGGYFAYDRFIAKKDDEDLDVELDG